uniref:Uncharacterized protein n=1 Tax=Anguilla anguilla TaxID=7936 RepID=A0A0E9RMD4_ANGAN
MSSDARRWICTWYSFSPSLKVR